MKVRLPLFYHLLFWARKLLPFIIAYFVLNYFNAEPWMYFFVHIAILGIHWYLWYSLDIPHRRRLYQTQIRLKAMRENKSYVVISRSFDQSQAGKLSRPHHVPHVHSTVHMSLFKALIHDLSREFPVVVLGQQDFQYDDVVRRAYVIREIPGDTIDWRDVFKDLCHCAGTVLIIPGETKGFLEELKMIKEDHRITRACIFMWPDNTIVKRSLLSHSASQWNSLLPKLAENGFQLPEHIPSGALIELNHKAEVKKIHPLNPKKWAVDILRTFVDPDVDGFPLFSRMGTLREYERDSKDPKALHMWNYIDRNYLGIKD